MKIIAGLGNPGEKYKKTRHNAGFILLDTLIEKKGSNWEFNKKLGAQICQDGETLYVKPQDFMNNSGFSINKVLSFYKLLPTKLFKKVKNSNLSETLTIVHDDVDISLGRHKISTNSRSAGHNGVQSIINHLKTKNFKRIRIGVLGSKEQIPLEKYVLQKFSPEELEIIEKVNKKIIEEEI